MAQADLHPSTPTAPAARVIAFPRAPLTAQERVVAAAALNQRASELDRDLSCMEDLARHASTVLDHLNREIAKFQRRLGR